MESKNVVFVKTEFDKLTNTWKLSEPLERLKRRLLAFPFVEHDDIVDSFDMLILFVFMDKRYMVYGRAFNESNIVNALEVNTDYDVIFFNKEGDIWKVCEIGIVYAQESKLYEKREMRFTASVQDGFEMLKKFARGRLIVDCSNGDGLKGMYQQGMVIEKYENQ